MESLKKHFGDEVRVLRRLLSLYAESPLVTEENRALVLGRMGHYYYFGYRTICVLDKSPEHFRLLMSLEKTTKKVCPDVWKEGGERSGKIRLMRMSGGLFYLISGGNEKLWKK